MLPNHIAVAIAEYLPPLEGWTQPDRACELAELIFTSNPKVVVEIGTFGGRSAIAQAFALRELNTGGKIYCIDPWRLENALEGEWEDNQKWYTNNVDLNDIHTRCMQAIWLHNLDPWMVVLRAPSQYCFELFPHIDVLLIDGNHSEIASYRDAELYVPRVRPGGYVLIDDLDWEVRDGDTVIKSTQKALAFIEERCALVKRIGNMGIYRKT